MKDNWGCLVSVIGLVVLIGYLTDVTNTKWWNAAGVKDENKIKIEKKPHDCEFLTAPLGNKNCHYDKVVQKTMWGTSTSNRPIVSFDDGKSWNEFTPEPGVTVPRAPTVVEVYVTWNRVTD
jgi:hypothetical protein